MLHDVSIHSIRFNCIGTICAQHMHCINGCDLFNSNSTCKNIFSRNIGDCNNDDYNNDNILLIILMIIMTIMTIILN